MPGPRRILLAAPVLLVLAACAGGASNTVSPSGLTSPAATESSSASASQSSRTLTFPLNSLPGYEAHGTVVVDIAGQGYTMTVTVEGLDPNSRHVINIHDTSCSSLAVTFFIQVDDVSADATGMAVSVTQLPNTPWTIPDNGRVLTVHGNAGTTRDVSHVACADLTN